MKVTRMIFTVTVALLLTTALTGTAVAQTETSSDSLYQDLENMVPTYNENIDDVDLGPVNLAGASNIYIQDGDSVVTYSVTMDSQNHITDLSDSPDENAVRKITTDRATLERIVAADNPAAAFRDALVDDDIVITGENGQILEGLKWMVINALKPYLL